MTAGLTDSLFWISLVVSLILAFIVAFPVNVWLISRGLGHAVIHQHAGH
jgi:Sec-independent protein secretion pathway component TatC